ncbi:Reverse transcriptase, partial [Phytophthora palmivora]
MHEIAAGVVSGRDAEENDVSEHLANDIELTDYAQELAFLPDLTEITVTALDYTGPNVQNKDLEGHAPIKQRARRTPLRFLGKLYELLKGLLRAGLITFSDSPCASPIVVVLKKNGVDIRLCIDYKMVNAITAIMEYAMPLVDDLLTDMESYLWFCSLDAASGFWAIMMTQRTRKISAFVCALGHFEWLRIPFGLKNAPMIYQRMIDNALWGFVQPKGGWSQFAKAMGEAEEQTKDARTVATEDCNQLSEAPPRARTKFEADRESSTVMDAVSLLVNSSAGDMCTNGESDESSLVPVFDRRSFVDDICFGNETFDGCLAKLDRLLQRFTECGISVSFTKTIFVQSKVNFLSHSRPRSFLGALNYYSRFIQDFAVYGAALYQLKDADFAPGGDLTVAKRSFVALQQKVIDAPILRHFDRDKAVHVMLFANEWALSSTLMQEHDGKLHPVRFCGRVLKDAEMNYHPAEKEVLAILLLLKVCYTQLA